MKRIDYVKKINNAGRQLYSVMRYIDCHDSVFREYVDDIQTLLITLCKIEMRVDQKLSAINKGVLLDEIYNENR